MKWLWGTDEQTELHASNNISSLIDKMSFKINSMTLGFVVLEELLMHTHADTT